MTKYRELPDTTSFKFLVDPSKLQYSKRRKAHRPRKEGIYKGPLILIKESPGIRAEETWQSCFELGECPKAALASLSSSTRQRILLEKYSFDMCICSSTAPLGCISY